LNRCYKIKEETETSLTESLKGALPLLAHIEVVIDEDDYTDDDDD